MLHVRACWLHEPHLSIWDKGGCRLLQPTQSRCSFGQKLILFLFICPTVLGAYFILHSNATRFWYIAWLPIILNMFLVCRFFQALPFSSLWWLPSNAVQEWAKLLEVANCFKLRVLLQEIQARFYLLKRPISFRQALDKQSEIWGGLSDAIFKKFVQYGKRLPHFDLDSWERSFDSSLGAV